MPERIGTCTGGIPLPGESPIPQQRRAQNISSLFRSQSINSLPPSEVDESRRVNPKLARFASFFSIITNMETTCSIC